MTVLAVSIGIVLGLLLGLRVIRSPWIFISLALLVAVNFGFGAAENGGLHTTDDLLRVIAVICIYGVGFMCYVAVPCGATFGVVTLVRYFFGLPPPRLRQLFRKHKFTLLGAATFGCTYLLYAIWLLTIARSLGGGVFENADFNSPILWLVEIFGPDRMIAMPDSSPLLLGVTFAIVGTIFYAGFGAMAGFVADSLKS